jgi:hypothetical protein
VRWKIDRTERGMNLNHQKGRGRTREKGRIREISLLMIIRRVEVLRMTDQVKRKVSKKRRSNLKLEGMTLALTL